MVDDRLAGYPVKQRIAQFARKRVSEIIQEGRGPPIYRRFVDGKEGAAEETVRFDGGSVVYIFSKLAGAALAGITYAREISHRQSGAYADAWIAVVDGKPWTRPFSEIPGGSEVIITNFAPYARRLEEAGRVGRSGRLANHPRAVYVVSERLRQFVQRRFPDIQAKRAYVHIPSGSGEARGWQVPYIRRTPPRGAIEYPAVILTEK